MGAGNRAETVHEVLGTIVPQAGSPSLPMASGKTMRRNRRKPEQPRFCAASSMERSMPRSGAGAPAGRLVPSRRLVTKERGTMRLIGTVAKPVCPGRTLAPGVSGMR